MISLSMIVNGTAVGPHEVPEAMPMVDYLNDILGLTGTKFGCGIGVCHACVVIVDEPDNTATTMRTCINSAASFAGKSIRTVEAHHDAHTLSRVQSAFLEHFAFQCGYCTAGFVNEATLLLERLSKKPIARDQVEETIQDALGEHICRCSGYVRYYEAMRDIVLSDPKLTMEG